MRLKSDAMASKRPLQAHLCAGVGATHLLHPSTNGRAGRHDDGLNTYALMPAGVTIVGYQPSMLPGRPVYRSANAGTPAAACRMIWISGPPRRPRAQPVGPGASVRRRT